MALLSVLCGTICYMNIQTFLINILSFLNATVLPFLFALAFLFFLWNATRYFIIGGSNEEDQTKAKALAVWGIAAFVFIVSLWGIVNLLVEGFRFGPNTAITPDYIQTRNGNSSGGSVNGNGMTAPGNMSLDADGSGMGITAPGSMDTGTDPAPEPAFPDYR